MVKNLLLIVLAVLFFSCKEKKVSLARDDEKVSAPEFLDFFHTLKTPYQVTDTIFRRKESESTTMSYKLFTRLVPDSIVSRYFSKDIKPRLYAVGKIKVPKEETYLFVKAMTKDRRVLYILCFDKEDHFAAARPVIYSDNESGSSGGTGLAGMDSKFTLTVSHQRKGPEGQVFFKRDAYVFNEDAHGFMLILTESNEVKTKIPAIYNPIDTLAHKHKFSGDYVQDKRNIISIRDGKDPSRFLFFIHFEKDDATCNGELKGEARFVSPGTARYKSYSDPCAIEFSFGTAGLSIKELGGCGVHRDIKCFFEGYYERRHEKEKAHPRN